MENCNNLIWQSLCRILTFRFLLAIFIVPFFYSCNKKPIEPSNQELFEIALQNLEIKCDDVSSDYYFSGKLNGEDLCYYDGHDGYFTYSAIGSIFITEGSVVTTSDDQEGLSTFGFSFNPTNHNIKERLTIKYLYPSTELREQKFLSTFRKGEYGFYSETDSPEGFSVELRIPFKENELGTGNHVGILSSRTGNQSNSDFRIIDINNQETEDNFFGEITFEFDCSLYHTGPAGNALYGNLSGELKMDYLFPK